MKSSENLQLKSPFPKDYLNIMFFALEKLIENEPTLLRVSLFLFRFGHLLKFLEIFMAKFIN